MTIDYDLFREKLNALNHEIFRMTNEQQVLPVLAIHKILKECEVREMTDKVKSEDFIKAFGSGVKETEHHLIKECKALEQTDAKGDLISRSALKNKFISTISVGRLEFEDIINLIDNAPTVPQPDFKAGYKQAILDGKTNFSRPQGEWIRSIHWDGTTNWYCSECGKKLEHGLTIEKFCYKCGADMRGKEE